MSPKKETTLTTHSFSAGNENIPFVLRRSVAARRTMTITVNQKADVLVSAPFHTAFEKIEAFILKKSTWIRKKVAAHKRYQDLLAKRRYVDGAQFLFLGKNYMLNVQDQVKARQPADFSTQGWSVKTPPELVDQSKEEYIKEKLNAWYRREAQEFLATRVFHYARIMNLEVVEVNVRTQRRIWGSCHPRTKRIFLNWQIIMAPVEVIDYVVIHELCHLLVANHSKRFWSKVAKFKPDYKEQVQWLRSNAFEMVLP